MSLFRPILATFAVALWLGGCGRGEETKKVAPWRASSAAEDGVAQRPFRLAPSGGSRLTFSVPAKLSTPRGTLEGPTGTIETDLSDLAQTRGRIVFSLEHLRVESADLGTDDARTIEAKNWLREKPATLGNLELVVSSLDDVKPLRPEQGERLADTSGSGLEVRRVKATLRGHLILRHLGVDVEMPLTLDFSFRASDEGEKRPERVVATLSRPHKIVLAEHDIVPRDPSGAVVLGQTNLIGSSIGRAALVEGAIEFHPLP